MQKKSHKLDGNHELPFALIAISCADSLLKMAWSLNKTIDLNLKESDYKVFSKENPQVEFPTLCDRESSDIRFFSLIPNKSTAKILVKELPNIDYFLEISGDVNRNYIIDLIKRLKTTKGIVAAIEIKPETIKRKSAFCPQ